MLPREQLLPGCGVVVGQLGLEQEPSDHLLMPAACRSQSFAYEFPSQPQTGTIVGSQLVGLLMHVPTGLTVAQAPGAYWQNSLPDAQATLVAPPHVALEPPAPPAPDPAAPVVPAVPVVPAPPVEPPRPAAPVEPPTPVEPAVPTEPP